MKNRIAARCSKCRRASLHARNGQRYCLTCHAAYMRRWRKTHPLRGVSLERANARAYARVYKSRGKLQPEPCEECKSPDVEMHHEDYRKPLQVAWLCRRCHRRRHAKSA